MSSPKQKFKGATKPVAKRKQFEGETGVNRNVCLHMRFSLMARKMFALHPGNPPLLSILSSTSHLYLMALALLRFGWF